jgi:hypothetical protein
MIRNILLVALDVLIIVKVAKVSFNLSYCIIKIS